MNRKRRKKIDAIIDALHQAMTSIEEIIEEEQESFDNLPETIQEGDQGAIMEEAINSLETARDELEPVLDYLEEAKG